MAAGLIVFPYSVMHDEYEVNVWEEHVDTVESGEPKTDGMRLEQQIELLLSKPHAKNQLRRSTRECQPSTSFSALSMFCF